jgi:hypothetical protein
MPDRTSTYRQIRLVVTPSGLHHRAEWHLATINVVKGVPLAQILDRGVLLGHHTPQTSEDVVELMTGAAELLTARWMLA